jgi:hypothetical protein
LRRVNSFAGRLVLSHAVAISNEAYGNATSWKRRQREEESTVLVA